VWVDECGHAPMMEHPDRFNEILDVFLKDIMGVHN
jgi:pimeloyl-ACP methyl ester carboxylesterase